MQSELARLGLELAVCQNELARIRLDVDKPLSSVRARRRTSMPPPRDEASLRGPLRRF